MQFIVWLVDYSNSLLGGESTAKIIALCAFLAFVIIYGVVFFVRDQRRAKEFARLSIVEEPKPITCPGCPKDFTDRLKQRSGPNMVFLSYKNYQITCEDCLAVSQWETHGYPVCLEWRKATWQEIERDDKKKQYLRRVEEIENFKKSLVAYENWKRLNGK